MDRLVFKGSLIIKNVSGSPYTVEEIDVVLEDQGQVDLMDHYGDWESARRLVTSTSTAKLYTDIVAGAVEVVQTTPPL